MSCYKPRTAGATTFETLAPSLTFAPSPLHIEPCVAERNSCPLCPSPGKNFPVSIENAEKFSNFKPEQIVFTAVIYRIVIP